MADKDALVEVGDIFHQTRGTDEDWATLYFDTDACELVVIEGSDYTGMYTRYSGGGTSQSGPAKLSAWADANPQYREKAVRLVTEKLTSGK